MAAMTKKTIQQRIEVAAVAQPDTRYILRLYVTGTTPNSLHAMQNLRKLCDEHLKGRYELEVIDVYQQPQLARGEQIIAAPTLIKQLPPPLRKFVGDLSDTEHVLMGLDIQPTSQAAAGEADAADDRQVGKKGTRKSEEAERKSRAPARTKE